MDEKSDGLQGLFDFLGAAYLKYSFTRGTDQEVAFLEGELGIVAGTKVLDVGCGPGRHALALAAKGVDVTGLDLSARFVELAAGAGGEGAGFVRGDGRSLPFPDAVFDVALSLCQGGFGLVGAEDGLVLQEMARVVRPGGSVAFSAFSSYFAVRFVEEDEHFDADAGINHERTTVRNEAGEERQFDLETSCFTPRELRLLCQRAGLEVRDLWSVTPGEYARSKPDLDHPEFLVVARRPGRDRRSLR